MSAEGQTTTEYIQHHLTNLHVGEGFWALHLDTLIVSALLGLIVFGTMWLATRKATAGVPSGMQNFVEMVVTMVDAQVKDSPEKIAPLAPPYLCGYSR
jgi:F-type H+-transporting ATPase subunit a